MVFGPSTTIDLDHGMSKPATVRPVLGGAATNSMVRTSRLIARKFGATLYVTDHPAVLDTAFTHDDKGRLSATFGENAPWTYQAHEITHIRNTWHGRSRNVARLNQFRVSPGAGYRFPVEGYETFFRADEAHARAVQVGILLRELTSASNINSIEFGQRLQELDRLISDGQKFVAVMNAEVAAFRAEVVADGGSTSIHKPIGSESIVIHRPIARRSAADAPDRHALMYIKIRGWLMTPTQGS